MKPYRRGSKRVWLPLTLLAVFGVNVYAADPGAEAFQQATCNACHTIGGGRLVGPDLAGINERRSQEWLVNFIRSSQSVINSGDAEAVALFEEYSGMLMPDAPISENEILEVLTYIAAGSTGTSSAEPTPAIENTAVAGAPAATTTTTTDTPLVDAKALEEQITLGQALFQGTVRFANGGATCNACHDIADDAILAGGILARELTDVFNRMGGPGVQAILGRPPFPVMEAAYDDQPLTEQEITALVAVLRYAAETGDQRLPRDYGLGLFTSGVAGAGLIFGSCSLIWRTRKRASVNQSIYDRQIKSS